MLETITLAEKVEQVGNRSRTKLQSLIMLVASIGVGALLGQTLPIAVAGLESVDPVLWTGIGGLIGAGGGLYFKV